MEHKTVNGAGGIVHYWVSRAEGNLQKANNSFAIVFTHGLTADHTMYEKQLEYFNNKYTLIVWDVPLHGLSRPYKNFNYKNTAKDLHLILEQENVEKVLLVGMSMGGYPSQMFAYMYPENTMGFVGVDTTPFGTRYYSKSDLWWLKKVAPMAKCFSAGLLRDSMAKSVSVTEYSYRKMLQMLEPLSKNDIIEQMNVAYGMFAKENCDIDLKCPVLILLGDRDKTGKVKQYCNAWAEYTGYTLHIVKDSAHFSNGDNAEQVNTEIQSFLDDILKTEGLT